MVIMLLLGLCLIAWSMAELGIGAAYVRRWPFKMAWAPRRENPFLYWSAVVSKIIGGLMIIAACIYRFHTG